MCHFPIIYIYILELKSVEISSFNMVWCRLKRYLGEEQDGDVHEYAEELNCLNLEQGWAYITKKDKIQLLWLVLGQVRRWSQASAYDA